MQDPEGSESRVFVRTVKKATSEGLVVSGGGKEGIFIKEVKPDSPASKHLTVKEGKPDLHFTEFTLIVVTLNLCTYYINIRPTVQI